jgi:hypothetical protein
MDSFGYAIFVFVPFLALVIGGGAWIVQARANRRIDALLSSDQTAKPNFSTGTIHLSDNAYAARSYPLQVMRS